MNRLIILFILLIGTPLFGSFCGTVDSAYAFTRALQAVVSAPPALAVGGASSEWYYAGNGEYPSVDYPTNTACLGQKLTCTTAGTISKIGVYINDYWGGGSVKLAIYHPSDGTLHESQTLTATTASWNDATLSTTLACTEGQTVLVLYELSTQMQVNRTAASGDYTYYQSIAYADFPPANDTGLTAGADKFTAVRMYVTH